MCIYINIYVKNSHFKFKNNNLLKCFIYDNMPHMVWIDLHLYLTSFFL